MPRLLNSDLTEEGEQMWKNIAAKMLPSVQELPVAPPKYQREFEFLVLQIKLMIQNSKDVIEDCDNIIKELKDADAYFANEAKFAKKLHIKNIDRLERILIGRAAFDYEVALPEEQFEARLSNLYYKPRR